MEIIKLNVIGERQRFGLRVLEAGYNVLLADLDSPYYPLQPITTHHNPLQPLTTLTAPYNPLQVLFADLDNIFLKSPEPLLRDGDIIGTRLAAPCRASTLHLCSAPLLCTSALRLYSAPLLCTFALNPALHLCTSTRHPCASAGERIWGRPMSLVKKWGAAICTGFYFVRSNRRTVKIFRQTHQLIVRKRQKQPKWQASDQWAINHAVDDQEVQWETTMPMAPMSDPHTRFHDNASAVGWTKQLRSKFVVLPHVYVARSCPILKYGGTAPPADNVAEGRKWAQWQHLLRTAYALHCFPPNSMPGGDCKHGSIGKDGQKCDKSVVMGHKSHIHGEVVFDQKQGLWFMRDGWEQAVQKPSTKDFFAWLSSQHNGLRPGQSAMPPP